ncbi:MAG: MATE family efflux transporter [Tannerella sp.]|jgi:putative MATE family efflux protein|nr:MATE family efflux transporter [Tannerella sp.]
MQQQIKTYTNKHIWNVSFPIIIGLLAQNIINVTDTAFLGRVGEVELGASAMGGLFYICLFTIFFGFSTGAQIIIGRRNGEKNYEAIGPVMVQGIFFLMVLAMILFGVYYFFAGNIMRVMISSEVIWEATMTFLKWRIIGFFFDVFNVMFRAFYIGITKTKILTLNAIVMALTNVGLDYALIFGKFGFPEMGLEGAAIASVMAEFASTLFYVIYTFFTINHKKYRFANLKSIDFKLLRQVLEISIYTMFQYFISMGTFFLFFVSIERQGQHTLAIANIVRSIYIVMFIPLNALSATANTLVSNIIGEGKAGEVPPLIRRISRISFLIMFACVILLCIFPKAVLSVYTNDVSLINESVPSIYVISVALIISSIAGVFFNSVSGTGNTRSALIIDIVVLIIYTIYIYLTGMYFKLPVHICFSAEIIYFIGLFIGSAVYLRFADWQKKKI